MVSKSSIRKYETSDLYKFYKSCLHIIYAWLQRPFRLPSPILSSLARGNGKVFKRNLGTFAKVVKGRVTTTLESSGH